MNNTVCSHRSQNRKKRKENGCDCIGSALPPLIPINKHIQRIPLTDLQHQTVLVGSSGHRMRLWPRFDLLLVINKLDANGIISFTIKA